MTPQFLRILLTTITLIVLKVINSPLIFPIASLFILDTVDRGLYNIFDNNIKCSKEDTPYQVNDKIIDLYAYFVFILLFYNKLDRLNLVYFILFFIYRVIGVYYFYKTENRNYLKGFFDGMNGLLVLFELSNRFDVIKKNYTILVVMMIAIKILFETVHHNV